MKTVFTSTITLAISLLLSACGGGGGGANVSDQSARIEIVGAGIKGPLAFADTKIYKLAPAFPQFYDPNNPISTAITNDTAQISGLSVPGNIAPPYILTIGGEHAVDLNTSKPPVISTLVTVITADMLAENRPIYMTPLTTLAFQMALYGSSAGTSAADFVQAMENAAAQASIVFAVSDTISVDIFSSPLVIDDNTDTLPEQEEAVHHRAALEAFAAKVHTLSVSLGNVSSDEVIKRLARDLQSDGVIDNTAGGSTVGGIDASVMLQDPMDLVIPNTEYRIAEITTLMDEERVLIGTDRGPAFYKDSIVLATSNTGTIRETNAGTNTGATGSSGDGSSNYSTDGLEVVTSQMVVTQDGAVISGKWFKDIQGKQALVILANNVTVTDSLFTNCDWCIAVQGADGLTVIGNRFEMVGHAVHAKDGSNNLTVEYNEVRGQGNRNSLDAQEYGIGEHGWHTSNFFQAHSTKVASISYNIIDNKDLETRFVEDFINIYGASNNIDIVGNKLRGSSIPGSISSSGGGTVIDTSDSGFLIKDNIYVRTVAYCAASAGGSNTTIVNNLCYLPADHADGLNQHPNRSSRGGSFSYGNTGYNGCGSGNKLLSNKGYAVNYNIGSGNNGIWNDYDDCGWAQKSGNEFPGSDPSWDSVLPDDMFAGLSSEYFSARH